ncbi:DUF3619 family protein [Janthinobacterium sp. NKUCC08_JDC]|uniref:DUF3619 family protein n=1 Tax=Janthinobacterium sp. NKUCC08_JDC TaxID=2842122 RepID=UPI001C5B4E1F|nr:DUF3619 family protein [Janthinobacterium sp. NKUCC08_JDC]MBW3497434.1 DUF3619 family protein [Janthinobacterium sp. NKUCC08_JDC]
MNTDDLNFAYKVRHALNEKLDDLPASATDRLATARKLALSRKKADAPAAVAVRKDVFAGIASSLFVEPLSWLGRMSVVIPLLLLVGGLVGIYQFEQEQHIAELAEIDAAVLSDELPLSAYMDHGFNAYLTKREQ